MRTHDYKNTKLEKFQHISINLETEPELIKTINIEVENALNYFKKIDNNIPDDYLLFNVYQIVKLEKKMGYKSYLHDFKVLEGNIYSFFEFILFLNDVEEGGEVEIMGKTKIKPEKGKLLIFPSGWCFPYCNKMPISDDQYIITGKIFKKF
jgi:hypothetical protein